MYSEDSLQASEYVATLEAVDNCSLNDTVKQDLQNELLNRASGSKETANKLVKVPQSLTNPAGYLTKPEIMNLMQGNIKHAPTIIAKRLKLAGLTSLKDYTKKPVLPWLSGPCFGRTCHSLRPSRSMLWQKLASFSTCWTFQNISYQSK